MATIAKIANGTLLKIGAGSGSPETFTTVPEVTRLRGPSTRFDLLDVTSHDTVGVFREYIPGLADGDMISGRYNFRPSNTVHKGMKDDAYAQTLRNFKVVFPDSSLNTVQCATYIQRLEPETNIGEVMTQDFGLKITGQPVWS